MMCEIDFVVTWVDSSDPIWLEEKNFFSDTKQNELNSEERFRDWDFFRYWFRSVEKNAPWVRKIHLVTYGHLPEWININNPKLNIVRHEEFMPKEALPTFNSQAIELCLHKINGLSENFVYFNDDMFLNNRVVPEDFFINEFPVDIALHNVITPHFGGIEHALVNNIEIINKYFSKRKVEKDFFFNFYNYRYGLNIIRNIFLFPWKEFTGFYEPHTAVSLKKSTFEKVWSMEEEVIMRTVNSKFREKDNLNFWLIRYWQICEGIIKPRNLNFSKMCYINEEIGEIISTISEGKSKIICINDSKDVWDYKIRKEKILSSFNDKFPNKSTFEI